MTPRPWRRFCGACGRPVAPNSRTWDAPVAYCGAHLDLAALDAEPADPLTSLPVTAESLADPASAPAGSEAASTTREQEA